MRHHFNLTKLHLWFENCSEKEWDPVITLKDWCCIFKLVQAAWPLEIIAQFAELPTKIDKL